MLVISTFFIKMLGSSLKRGQKISIFNKFDPTQEWIRFGTLLEHLKKFIFQIKIIKKWIQSSFLVSQRRERGVLGYVTCVLLYENIFFDHHLKAEASTIIFFKLHRVSFFCEEAPTFWKKGSKIDDFFAKIFNIFA